MHTGRSPPSPCSGLQGLRDGHTAGTDLAFGEMQTSGLKESWRYTSGGKGVVHKTLPRKVAPRKPSIPHHLYSLRTSPSFYLVFFQLIDLYLEAEAADQRLALPFH